MTNQKIESKKLLNTLKTLSENDIVIDTFLRLAETEVRAELQSSNIYAKVDDDYIDQSLIDKRLLGIAETIIVFQTQRCANLDAEVKSLTEQLQK